EIFGRAIDRRCDRQSLRRRVARGGRRRGVRGFERHERCSARAVARTSLTVRGVPPEARERAKVGGSAWESNPASPNQRGATDFEDREGHRAPFTSRKIVVRDLIAECGLACATR